MDSIKWKCKKVDTFFKKNKLEVEILQKRKTRF